MVAYTEKTKIQLFVIITFQNSHITLTRLKMNLNCVSFNRNSQVTKVNVLLSNLGNRNFVNKKNK